MYLIQRPQTDPYFNLAAEEYLLKHFEHDCFMLWRNEASIVVGKHQNTFAEINPVFVSKHQIPVIRRISGGGTVFHDPGNINFSFVSKGESGKLVDFKKFAEPVIQALKQMGLDAKFEGKNDLRIDGLKISGNAEHVFKNKVLHHGTLLFNSKLDILTDAIRVKDGIFKDKAVQSNRSKVVNIAGFMKTKMDVHEFMEILQKHLRQLLDAKNDHTFTSDDLRAIGQLADEKYKSWEWNYGYSPPFTFTREFTIDESVLAVEISVEKGMIKAATIADPKRDWKELLQLITGERFDARHIFGILKKKLPFENLDADLLNAWITGIFY